MRWIVEDLTPILLNHLIESDLYGDLVAEEGRVAGVGDNKGAILPHKAFVYVRCGRIKKNQSGVSDI